VSAGELLGFDSGGTALHVHDLAVPESNDHRIPPPKSSVGIPHLCGADDLVVTDASEGEILDRPSVARLQDLTGLVLAASGGCVFPPEVAAREAAPLSVFGEERDERLRVALVQRLGGRTKLVDHGRSMRPPG
jgi:hypothetical protein